MEIYLVGGAVRDQLLGLPIKEKDWVVVGATAADMLNLKYRQVGKDFPVFLHPETQEEYALARVERKVGPGYGGFNFDTAPTVTLEEDLQRRDLTINAMAQKSDGTLIDPYHGKMDLNKKLLRHVSPAFVEDPVRILRVARFVARFASLGFTIAPETNSLMQSMVTSGEVNALVAERVWKELERALEEKTPAQFFHVLADCGALSVLFPDFNTLAFNALERAATLSTESIVRFAALCHVLSDEQIAALCDRYRIPSNYRELALLVSRHYRDYAQGKKLSPSQLLALLQDTDAFRRVERFTQFLTACEAVTAQHESAWFLEVCATAKAIDIKEFINNNYSGKEIATLIEQKRLDSIKKLFN